MNISKVKKFHPWIISRKIDFPDKGMFNEVMEDKEGVSEQQLAAMKDQVGQEIDQLTNDPLGLSKIHRYLNNFEMWLPGGANRRFSEKLGQMDKPYREYSAENREWNSQLQVSPKEKDTDYQHSQLRMNQTDRQFYETIDKAIESEGLSLEEIEAFNERNLPMTLTQFRQKMLPLYIRLRAMGYTREDLHT